jgi:hypothetical protein
MNVHKPKATWVRPEVGADIEYDAVTDDGLPRAAVSSRVRSRRTCRWCSRASSNSSSMSRAPGGAQDVREQLRQVLPAVDAGQIVTTFNAIGSKLSQLRVAK